MAQSGNRRTLRILFAGGKTGGHLFPIAGTVQALRRLLEEIAPHVVLEAFLAGATNALEQRIAHRYELIICRLSPPPLPRRASQFIAFPWRMRSAIDEASRRIDEIRPDLVVGVGGYTSFPVAHAATSHKIPLILLEQNAVAGQANRWLATKAERIFTPWTVTANSFHRKHRYKITCTGTPLRECFQQRMPSSPSTDTTRLLVLGGSSGSDWLNRTVPFSLANLPVVSQKLRVVHLAGNEQVVPTRRHYETHLTALTDQRTQYEILPFDEELPEKMFDADLAVCRAGGTTLAELAAAQLPAILIPLPHAKDDHQRENARWFEKHDAAVRLETHRQPNEDPARQLTDSLDSLLRSPERRNRIADALQTLARPGAASQIARELLDLLPDSKEDDGSFSGTLKKRLDTLK